MLSPFARTGNYYGNVASNAIISGTVSALSGGKFANGAIMGAFRYMFNDALHKTHEEIMEMQYKHWKGGYKAYLAEQKRIAYDKMIRERFPHTVNLMQSNEQAEYYQNRLAQYNLTHPQINDGLTSNQVGLALSVGALVIPGGLGYAMAAAAIALDLSEPDYIGAGIGGAAMYTRHPALQTTDIAYGIVQVVGE